AIALVYFLHGGTKIYTNWRLYGGLPYLLLSAFVYLAIQDSYYYWAHRLMHHPRLFLWMHAGHHRSRQPTPFASFAFDPAEAALTGWLMPAMVFFVPIHIAAVVAPFLFLTLVSALHHSGRVILPPPFLCPPLPSPPLLPAP